MFRVWPRFARKNMLLLIGVRLPGRQAFTLPVPLLLVDEMLDPLLLLGSAVSRFVPDYRPRFVENLQINVGGVLRHAGMTIRESWNSVRWRGAFTLMEIDSEDMRISVRFI